MAKTPLHDAHKALGAKIVDFHGWDMPVQYSGIIDEHMAVRKAIGLFDVSHMGEVVVRGQKAHAFIQNLITNDIDSITDGQAIYSPMCLPEGGIVDDLLVYRHAKDHFLIVVNASNIEKDFSWMRKNSLGADLENKSDYYALIAIQGPRAHEAMASLFQRANNLSPMHFIQGRIHDVEVTVSRSGYTGEDGFEIFCPSSEAVNIWNACLLAGKEFGIKPCGLGARDSLRLEAGLMLYGNDMDEKTTPLEAPLKWTVRMEKTFIGKQALEKNTPMKKLVGFEMLDKRVPRHGNRVFIDGKERGTVTSGIFSPLLNKYIGFCFVPPEHPKEKNIEIEIGSKLYGAKVTGTRFYKRAK